MKKPNEEEEVKPLFHSNNVGDYFDEIENMFNNRPKKAKKKEWREWAQKINKLIDECNELAKRKIYEHI